MRRELEVLYKPVSRVTQTEIHGIMYHTIEDGPNVYVLQSEDLPLLERNKNISFKENNILHVLLGCDYNVVDDKLHIECNEWSQRVID